MNKIGLTAGAIEKQVSGLEDFILPVILDTVGVGPCKMIKR